MSAVSYQLSAVSQSGSGRIFLPTAESQKSTKRAVDNLGVAGAERSEAPVFLSSDQPWRRPPAVVADSPCAILHLSDARAGEPVGLENIEQ